MEFDTFSLNVLSLSSISKRKECCMNTDSTVAKVTRHGSEIYFAYRSLRNTSISVVFSSLDSIIAARSF